VAGRPSLLTSHTAEQLAFAVESGMSAAAAARFAGIAPRTLRLWRATGSRQLRELPATAKLELALRAAEERTPRAQLVATLAELPRLADFADD
jgi:transposase-like protein